MYVYWTRSDVGIAWEEEQTLSRLVSNKNYAPQNGYYDITSYSRTASCAAFLQLVSKAHIIGYLFLRTIACMVHLLLWLDRPSLGGLYTGWVDGRVY